MSSFNPDPFGRDTTLHLSFVIPVYGCPDAVEPLCTRIQKVCEVLGETYEIILIDDRCPYKSWPHVLRMAEANPAVRAMRLSRNFGQYAAIQAGLTQAIGVWTIVMDCDLQDHPEDVPALLAEARQGGWHIVQGARDSRKHDPWYRRVVSFVFYKLLGLLTGTTQDPAVANFGIYSRSAVDVIKNWNEQTKYLPAVVQWIGFSRTSIPVTHDARFEGRSGYTFAKLVDLATNVIVGFSDLPLKLLMACGLTVAVVTILAATKVFFSRLFGPGDVEGWTSLILSLWFIAGWMTFSMGLLGLYIGRILVEAKDRPSFIIEQIVQTRASEPKEVVPLRSP